MGAGSGGTSDNLPVMVAVERVGSNRFGRIRLRVASAPGGVQLVDLAASVVGPCSTIRAGGPRMLHRLGKANSQREGAVASPR